MLFLIWALLSAYMLLAIDLLSFGLGRRGWSRFISSFLLFYSQIILTEFVLGTFSILGGFSLVILNLLLTSVLMLFIFKRFGEQIIERYRGGR